LVRKNALFAGSKGGADHWALVGSLIQTAKLNDIDPFEYLKDVLETLPWNWKPAVNGWSEW